MSQPAIRSVEEMKILLLTVPFAEAAMRVRNVLTAPLPEDPDRARDELERRARLVTALRLAARMEFEE